MKMAARTCIAAWWGSDLDQAVCSYFAGPDAQGRWWLQRPKHPVARDRAQDHSLEAATHRHQPPLRILPSANRTDYCIDWSTLWREAGPRCTSVASTAGLSGTAPAKLPPVLAEINQNSGTQFQRNVVPTLYIGRGTFACSATMILTVGQGS
jgi:hypothetical protein